MSDSSPSRGAASWRPSISIVDHIHIDDEGRSLTEPLRNDIRLLGTILGDTVRTHSGDDIFDLVEGSRRDAFRIRRGELDRDNLADRYADIDIAVALPIIRAFSHFALLSNLAEDIHRERRRRIHVRAGDPPQTSSLAATYSRLAAADLSDAAVGAALADATVVPVITAHPTETRRRSVFEAQHRITDLLRAHLRQDPTPEEDEEIIEGIRRQILTLWQTALIRLERPRIEDEIRTGLRYYDAAFFEVVPKINTQVRQALRGAYPDAGIEDQPMIRMGSWIGGDRDGNPYVTEEVVGFSTTMAARTAIGHYLEQLEVLGMEMSLSTRLTVPFDALYALTGTSPEDPSADEPYRIALRHIRSRLAAKATAMFGEDVMRTSDLYLVDGSAPYETAGELLADLDVIDAALRANSDEIIADDRLRTLREGVRTFGFNLYGLDMRQNSDMHEEVVAELIAWAGVHPDYTSLDEDERVALLSTELTSRRPLIGPDAELSELATKELGIVRAAAKAVALYGPEAVPNYIISMCQSVSDMLEAMILLKEAGLFRPQRRIAALDGPGGAAVRDYRGSSAGCGDNPCGAGCSVLQKAGGVAAGHSGDHARLLRFQQGRRIHGRELGAVSGRTRPRRGGEEGGYPSSAVPRSRRHRGPWRRAELRRDPRPAAGRGAGFAADHRAG